MLKRRVELIAEKLMFVLQRSTKCNTTRGESLLHKLPIRHVFSLGLSDVNQNLIVYSFLIVFEYSIKFISLVQTSPDMKELKLRLLALEHTNHNNQHDHDNWILNNKLQNSTKHEYGNNWNKEDRHDDNILLK
jgi:hypothetical protein